MKKAFRPAWLVTFLLLLCGATGSRAQSTVVMRGDVSYWVSGSKVQIFIEDLTNFSDTTTDRIRIRLWASKHHWNYYDRGHLIAFSRLARLLPYQNFSDLHPRIDLHRPSTGWYHVTLTLEERMVDTNNVVKWGIRDIIEFDGLHYFQRSPWPVFPF